jgi:hypothetical protein
LVSRIFDLPDYNFKRSSGPERRNATFEPETIGGINSFMREESRPAANTETAAIGSFQENRWKKYEHGALGRL